MKSQILLKNLFRTLLFMLALLLFSITGLKAQNDAMMQAFYWNVPVNVSTLHGSWWDTLNSKATMLKNAGITGLWVPCPAKGNWGITDMGYGIYDHYDLGNYFQKGSTETRFGSRQALTNMLQLATREAGWDINLAASLAVINTPASQPVLH